MASRGLGTLTLDLVAKIGGFEQGMDKAARHADKRLSEIEKRANKFGKVIGTAIATGAAAAVAGLVAVTKNAIDSADRLNDISKRLGVSTEALSAWGYAAKQSGTDLEALNTGLTRFTKNVAAAADSNSRQGEIFAALGIAVKDAAGNLRSVEDLVPEVATAFEKMDNATLESALSMELFGKSGAQLLQFLNLGGAGLDEMAQKASNLGIIVSQDTAEAADKFKDELEDLKSMMAGVGLQIAQDLLPALSQLIVDFREAAKEGGGVDLAMDGLAVAFETVVGLASVLSNTLKGVTADLSAVASVGASAWAVLTGNFAGAAGHLEEAAASRARAAEASRNISGTLFGRERRTTPIPDLQVPFLQPLFPQFSAVPLQTAGGGQSAAEKKLNDLLNNAKTPKAGGGKKGGGRNEAADALKDQARQAKEARDELERLVDQEARARESFEAMAASLAGPLADANYQYIQDQKQLNELARDGAIGADDLRVAQENLAAAHEKTVEAINKQLTPSQEVIAGLQEELAMLGMTNEQQEIYNNLKYAEVDANTAAGQSIVQLTENLQRAREARMLMDDLKDSTKSFLVDMTDGVGTAREAWDDFFDNIKRRAMEFVADKAINALFGALSGGGGGGSTGVMNPITGGMVSGGGSSGAGFWTSLLGAFMGGGRASGGSVMAGGLYPVNERGTEMLSIGGRDYLMMGSQAGHVTPNHEITSGPGGSRTVINNFSMSKRNDNRSERQVAKATGMAIRAAR